MDTRETESTTPGNITPETPQADLPPAGHIPVLPVEVMAYLNSQSGQTVVDATLGAGGHSLLIAKAVGPTGKVIALDHDQSMIDRAMPRLAGYPVEAIHARYDILPEILATKAIPGVDGLLADLGICSEQLDAADRGFSFSRPGPLDMRMDQSRGQSASDLVNHLSEYDLADLIYRYGEERFSRKIARYIVTRRGERRFEDTADLASVVRRAIPRKDPSGIHPATRTFQALRIAVNDELNALEGFLGRLHDCIKPGGVAVVISFHSLEDRLVKNTFRQSEYWEILTKKPIMASDEEQNINPRSRSARLRAARRIDPNQPKVYQGGKYR
jgi:16S rRNA (cytosine1402-N4)-methyltransferase